MSQHSFKTTHKSKPLTVVLGWDKPLQRYYMYVEIDVPANEGDGEEEELFLYNSLYDEAAILSGRADGEYFRNKLIELGITVPESVFAQAHQDCGFNRVNRVVVHQADGTFEVVAKGN